MGQLFGQGGTPDVLIRPVLNPQIGYGMPPGLADGQGWGPQIPEARDQTADLSEWDKLIGTIPNPELKQIKDGFGQPGQAPAQPVAPPSGQKQYTFKNPDGTTYQHSLYKEPTQPVAPQQPTPDIDAEDHGAPGIVDDGGIENMPGPGFDPSKFFSKFGAGSGGPVVDPGINRGPQLGGGPAKTGPMATPMTLPQQPTQTQQPSWFAQTTDAQSPLLNTVGIWR